LKIITEGSIQLSLKKTGTKIYPVRFAEIEKLEVVTPGLLTKA
jgi:ribosomal protein S3AE